MDEELIFSLNDFKQSGETSNEEFVDEGAVNTENLSKTKCKK